MNKDSRSIKTADQSKSPVVSSENRKPENIQSVTSSVVTDLNQAISVQNPALNTPIIIAGNNDDKPVKNTVVGENDNVTAKVTESEIEPVAPPVNESPNAEVSEPANTSTSFLNKTPPIASEKKLNPTTRKKEQRSNFHEGKLFASISFSPMLSYRSFQLTKGAAPFVNKQYDEIRQNAESKIISYGSALSLEYKILKNFSLQSGISYNRIGFQSNYEFDVYDKATTDNNGRVTGYEYVQNPYTVNFDSKTQIDVLRIPFGVNYNLFMNSNSLFHFYFGGSHDMLLAAEGNVINSLTLEQKSITKEDFRHNANEVCVDLGVNIALTSRYAFGVDLYYNKWLTNISMNKFENITPFTAGLNLALTRKIY
jgi:hypothetical protein